VKHCFVSSVAVFRQGDQGCSWYAVLAGTLDVRLTQEGPKVNTNFLDCLQRSIIARSATILIFNLQLMKTLKIDQFNVKRILFKIYSDALYKKFKMLNNFIR
jgi:hypothetical protein